MNSQPSFQKDLLPSQQELESVRAYIKKTWKTLTRSQAHILDAAKDTKLDHRPGTPWPIYISTREDCSQVEQLDGLHCI